MPSLTTVPCGATVLLDSAPHSRISENSVTANFVEIVIGEVRRILLPRTRVNKGNEDGRSPLGPQPRFRGLAIPASDALATRPTRPGHSP